MTIEMLLLFLVKFIIIVALVGGFLWVCLWLIGKVGFPEPVNKIVTVVFYIVCAVIALLVLLWAMSALGVSLGGTRLW